MIRAVRRYYHPETIEQHRADALCLALIASGEPEERATTLLAEEIAARPAVSTGEQAKAHALEHFEAEGFQPAR